MLRDGLRDGAADLARLLPFLAFLLGLHILGPALTTPWLLSLWALLALLPLAALWQRARARRSAFLLGGLRADSPWHRRLRGGALMFAMQLAQALILATILLTAALRLETDTLWWLLAATLPLMALLHRGARHWLRPHAAAHVLPALSLGATRRLAFALLFPVLATLALFTPHPDFSGVTLQQAVWHEVLRQEAASAPAQWLLQAAAAKDAGAWWLGQHVLPSLERPLLQLAAWAILLGAEGLFLWSYLMACCGAIALGRRTADSMPLPTPPGRQQTPP